MFIYLFGPIIGDGIWKLKDETVVGTL